MKAPKHFYLKFTFFCILSIGIANIISGIFQIIFNLGNISTGIIAIIFYIVLSKIMIKDFLNYDSIDAVKSLLNYLNNEKKK